VGHTRAMGQAARHWARLQAGRGLPPEILARAPADPWRHDPRDFAAPEVAADTPSRAAGAALLGEAGTVLDVGCGGGAAALALAGSARALIGVDRQRDMLAAFAARARARAIPVTAICGDWPQVAPAAGRADVVVCRDVLHNVVDLPPFLLALTAAARRGVVVEMRTEHPMAWLDPLFVRFHDLHRPPSATAGDAAAVLAELGVEAEMTIWQRAGSAPHDPRWVARRLCLGPQRLGEVEAALAELPGRPRRAATLTWRV